MSKGKEDKQERQQIDLSGFPKNEKGEAILPNALFEEVYKLCPNGTRNESGNFVAWNGGKLYRLGSDPEHDKVIHTRGAEALNAKMAQRQTMSQTIDMLLKKPAKKDVLDKLGLPEGTDNQTAALVALLLQMQDGDTKAANFLRDTVGEKPIDKKEVDANIITEADRKLLEKVSKRLEEE